MTKDTIRALDDLTRAGSLLAVLEVADIDHPIGADGSVVVDSSVLHDVVGQAREMVWRAHKCLWQRPK